jgi:hypothetical protein
VSSWKREGSQIFLEAVVPGNTRATLFLPPHVLQLTINIDGKETRTVTKQVAKEDKMSVELESGTYRMNFLE